MAAPALVSRLNDCRSCYKCIRACPTKSISFSDGHAQIVQDECVYCGRCYIACPQDCKIVRDDLLAAKRLVMEGEAYVSLAPSFQAAFPCTSFEVLEKGLLDLGFKGVEETAVGATIVKKEYERLVKEAKEDIIISTCCHSLNLLVEKHFPAAKKYLAPVLSPMLAHGLDLKKRHPGAKVVFVGPCIAKKDEIDRYPGYVDCVLTFKEIKRWFGEKGIDLSIDGGVKKLDASRARLFPIEGGILKTMDKSEDDGYSYLAISGMERCIAALEDIIDGRVKKKVFIEMSACPGSCIAGPLVAKTERALISDYLAIEESAGKDDFDVGEIPLSELGKRFATLKVKQAEPSEEEIRAVLKKIGKNSPKDELNCSSCGYPTCRAKAIAVIRGKANLEMCLPYLMNKAESFSNTIVEQSENAIVVLSPSLSIVLANPRMASLLGAKDGKELIGKDVSSFLDAVPFAEALGGKDTYRKKVYLAEYGRYMEMSVTFDSQYQILIGVYRDVTASEQKRKKEAEIAEKAASITTSVIEKNMRAVQEIASLLGESTAATKVALSELKDALKGEGK